MIIYKTIAVKPGEEPVHIPLSDDEMREYEELQIKAKKEQAEIDIDKQQKLIKQQLDDIDLQSIRAIRANDTKRLKDLENQAEKLRERLK
jgi:hypothetical protein